MACLEHCVQFFDPPCSAQNWPVVDPATPMWGQLECKHGRRCRMHFLDCTATLEQFGCVHLVPPPCVPQYLPGGRCSRVQPEKMHFNDSQCFRQCPPRKLDRVHPIAEQSTRRPPHFTHSVPPVTADLVHESIAHCFRQDPPPWCTQRCPFCAMRVQSLCEHCLVLARAHIAVCGYKCRGVHKKCAYGECGALK